MLGIKASRSCHLPSTAHTAEWACAALLLLLAGLGAHLSPQLLLEPKVLVPFYGSRAGHRAVLAHGRQAATTNTALEPHFPLS